MKKSLIILDAGHGKDTPGKRSPVWADGSQLFEYEFNRDQVRRIALLLPKGFTYILVPELTDIPLWQRVRRVNLVAARNPNILLVSIHANAGGGTGWEVWTSPGQTESDQHATGLFNALSPVMQAAGFPMRKDTVDGDVDKESRFQILTGTNCPAVLTENLFMDTLKDCKYIMSNEGRQAIAAAHANYLKTLL